MITLLVLFFAPLLAGLLGFVLPTEYKNNYRLWLVFAGSYLFAITVSHVLPELYQRYGNIQMIGIFVLAGFFFQQVLEYFTSGIEHGHEHSHEDHNHDHSHNHSTGISAVVLLLALCIHAFLEGAMLTQPVSSGPVYDVHAVLLGIVLHRVPAAFALMTVLIFQLKSKKKALVYLVIFSLAAPVGLILSRYLTSQLILQERGLLYLYALVCGNFLYISTTIAFESSPEHKFNGVKLMIAVVGALVALGAEWLI